MILSDENKQRFGVGSPLILAERGILFDKNVAPSTFDTVTALNSNDLGSSSRLPTRYMH